ncbi:MAG: hypothetical protein AB7F19_05020 [Candidatus Babeliales bacterium]
MKRSRLLSMSTPQTPWPPVLLLTRLPKQALAKQFYTQGISISSFISAQLDSARAHTFNAIAQQTQLPLHDIHDIIACTKIVKERDAQTAQQTIVSKQNDYQDEMHEYFPEINEICKIYNVITNFSIFFEPEGPFDAMYDRPLKYMVYTINGALQLARPENNIYSARPELSIGSLFYQLDNASKFGCLARNIAGHIHCEHTTEWYFLKEIMKLRKTPLRAVQKASTALHELHELEADLVPASQSSMSAHRVLCWLRSQQHGTFAPLIQERISNVKAVRDLLTAYEALQKNN